MRHFLASLAVLVGATGAGAQPVDPASLPWNPVAWTARTTSRSDDGKTGTLLTRYWLSGQRLRFETREGGPAGRRVASAYYDFATQNVWTWDPGRDAYLQGSLSLPVGRGAAGWRRAGREKVAGLACDVYALDRGQAVGRKAIEAKEWRAGSFVMKSVSRTERSSVRLLGMVLPVPARTQTTEVTEIRRGGVEDADVALPADAKVVASGGGG